MLISRARAALTRALLETVILRWRTTGFGPIFLVVKIAFEYQGLQNLMDLIQEGNLGLMKPFPNMILIRVQAPIMPVGGFVAIF